MGRDFFLAGYPDTSFFFHLFCQSLRLSVEAWLSGRWMRIYLVGRDWEIYRNGVGPGIENNWLLLVILYTLLYQYLLCIS